VTDYLRPIYTGSNVLVMGDLATEGIDSRTHYGGVIDGSTPNGDMIGGGLIADFTTLRRSPPIRTPTPFHKEWMSEFLETDFKSGRSRLQPEQHRPGLCLLQFEPKSDLPIKVIVFDDTQHDENFDFGELGVR